MDQETGKTKKRRNFRVVANDLRDARAKKRFLCRVATALGAGRISVSTAKVYIALTTATSVVDVERQNELAFEEAARVVSGPNAANPPIASDSTQKTGGLAALEHIPDAEIVAP